jgi:hypothetical protein
MPPTHTTEGLDAARIIREEFPETAILVLSAHVEVEHAMDLLASGRGSGYLHTSVPHLRRAAPLEHDRGLLLTVERGSVGGVGVGLVSIRRAAPVSKREARVGRGEQPRVPEVNQTCFVRGIERLEGSTRLDGDLAAQ